MTVAQDAVQQPIKAIRALYTARSDDSDDSFGVKTHFTEVLASGAVIPVLTEKTMDIIPNQSLVRFRGMVQDMLNPEYYVGEYKRADGTWHTSRFTDDLEEALPSNAETKLAERKPLLVIPVPAESPWVSAMLEKEAAASIAGLASSLNTVPSATSKRPREDISALAVDQDNSISMMESDATTDAGVNGNGVDIVDSASTRPRRPVAESNGAAASAPAVEKNPAPLPPGACLVYVYDNDDSIKLNGVVEVVGVLSRVPELAAVGLCACTPDAALLEPSMLDLEMLEVHPPTSQAPRVHAVLIKKEESIYPTLSTATTTPTLVDAAAHRARAVGFLSMVLGGDDLAAEYLLLQLVSRVHVRGTETGAGALGTLPLNLTNCPSAESGGSNTSNTNTNDNNSMSPLGEAIAAALAALAPRCATLPLRIPSLNACPWWPRRADSDLRLSSGPLQIAEGTQCVIDETVMAAGTLTEVGLRNLAALQTIMQSQKVSYDFQYFALDQSTDAPVTVLSTACTMLKGVGEVVVPLRPATTPASGAAVVSAAVAAGDAEATRAYVAAVRGLEFSIPEAVGKVVEGELAAAKQKDAANVNADTFHRWLNVARLMAVSYGEQELTVERWGQAMALERRRQERVDAGTQ